MENGKKLRLAAVGCGHWGKNIVRNLAELGYLAAVCDASAETAATFASKYEVPAQTWPEVLASDVSGVTISAPAVAHYSLAKEALLAGKDVFVEKPLSLRVEQARELCELAEGGKRVLMVGHLLRYHPAFMTLEDLVGAGELGRVNYVYSNRVNLGRIRTEENTLWSFAPHDISMILSLLGSGVESVYAAGHCYLHKEIADVTTTHIKFASGQAAHVFVSWLHPFKEQRLIVVGEKAMAVFDDTEPWARKLVLYRHRINWDRGIPSPDKAAGEPVALEEGEPLGSELSHFAEAVRTRQTPRTDGREGLAVLSVLDAAQQSMQSGKPEALSASSDYQVHPTAVVDQPSRIGKNTKIWHFSHVLAGSDVGERCNIGQNVVIGPDVKIGNGCKIQNNVSVYKGVTLEDDVFCGPSMVFTNVVNPRSEIVRKHEIAETHVGRGATIGANATIVCGVKIGRYAFVGAGAVVTRDLPAHALAYGNPARVVGTMCRCGVRLPDGDWPDSRCESCGAKYERQAGNVEHVSG